MVAALALGIGGLAPGALYASAPHAAPNPSAVPATIGLLQQASNLGQFAGPVAVGVWVAHSGWEAAPAIVVPAAVIGLATALAIRGVTDWRAQSFLFRDSPLRRFARIDSPTDLGGQIVLRNGAMLELASDQNQSSHSGRCRERCCGGSLPSLSRQQGSDAAAIVRGRRDTPAISGRSSKVIVWSQTHSGLNGLLNGSEGTRPCARSR